MTAVERYQEPSFDGLMRQAEVLARSNIVPKAFRGKPGDIVVATLLGREIGLGPMATMAYVDVIEGNATLNAEGKVALVRRAGHSISGTADAAAARVEGKRHDSGDHMEVTWTMQMASRAGLAGKQVWKQYPEAMLWSRAVSQLCRMLFPDVLMGLSYTGEEVEAFAPEAERVVDEVAGESVAPAVPALPSPRSTLRPPPGSNGPAPREQVPGETSGGVSPDTAADDFDRAAFKTRLAQMPAEFRQLATGTLKEKGIPPWGHPDLTKELYEQAVAVLDDADDLARTTYAKREKAAVAAMKKVGVTGDEARATLVREATGGQTESTKALTEAQLTGVTDYCDGLAAQDAS